MGSGFREAPKQLPVSPCVGSRHAVLFLWRTVELHLKSVYSGVPVVFALDRARSTNYNCYRAHRRSLVGLIKWASTDHVRILLAPHCISIIQRAPALAFVMEPRISPSQARGLWSNQSSIDDFSILRGMDVGNSFQPCSKEASITSVVSASARA